MKLFTIIVNCTSSTGQPVGSQRHMTIIIIVTLPAQAGLWAA
jgi:hypothetical protein